MRTLPHADPGVPDARSPFRYLWWTARGQAGPLLAGIGFAVLWWLAQALVPAALGRAIDSLTQRDTEGLVRWSAIMLVLGVTAAFGGVMRHRRAVYSYLAAAYRTVQVTARQATRLGATLPKLLSTGEVISVGNSDISHIGSALDILLRGTGSLIAIAAVTVILLVTSPELGLTVLIGVPLMALAVVPLLRPLHRWQHTQRDLQGELATRASDIVAGLRVLRGIGGEQVFADRYRAQSQRVRTAGVRVASVNATLDAAQVLLPGLLIAFVTWRGAHLALDGTITVGQLVAFYGYALFLVGPLRTLTEMADKLTKGHVAARRVVRILSLNPEVTGNATATGTPGGDLADPASGVTVPHGRFTALVSTVPEDAIAVADRLGLYAAADVTLGGVPLADLPLEEVRRRVLVADNGARLFSGRLRDQLDVTGTASGDDLRRALHTAGAEDIVEALPDGLDAHVAEAGREFSGGQRQRLRLARALVADPEVLILVEPTSAVDAHTEARIAERLGQARAGRTTLVCTTSPLVLDHADHVIFMEDGVARAEGSHRHLLATRRDYAATVTRSE
ncbi:multidrug ABC transporter permease [Sphaerisporangium siamense]|uniref:ABC-type multidrug transport system fused ATPase/permease subunit n=1 Tax=Sphaerisporangium siamense TaxID=795645 RepID=A0A7W7D662_9ACTN|nr:ABC transporter ATP-binding protein [Sphaerisporangium siamense]MBB4700917.1 ABC-type multidrug transport system fused ATPase/permease subunit [Sphaerisporangium siamense]GII85938.1 multidrug ABC transporter permease [Sphaerisporangium siamense]